MERMRFVLDADGLGEQELGELLRRRGVHREQLDAWRAAAEAFGQAPATRKSPENKRIKELEREVARKDKALAETAALLVLQKKTWRVQPVSATASRSLSAGVRKPKVRISPIAITETGG